MIFLSVTVLIMFLVGALAHLNIVFSVCFLYVRWRSSSFWYISHLRVFYLKSSLSTAFIVFRDIVFEVPTGQYFKKRVHVLPMSTYGDL